MSKPTRVLLLAFILISVSVSSEAGYHRAGHYTLEEVYASIEALGERGGDLVEVSSIGESVKGRPLMALRIGRPDGRERPRALVYGNVHAVEWMGSRMSLAIAERLIDGAGADLWIDSLLGKIEFHVIPLMNPDGYNTASKHLDLGFTMARDNKNRVDLNRNWPQAAGAAVDSARGVALGGSNFKYNPNYRGPYPLSEPENVALDAYVRDNRFFIAFDLHTVGGRFSYPWSYKQAPAPDKEIYEAVGHEMTSHQPYHRYQVHQSYSWYQIVGASKDWFYGKYGTLAITIELGITREFDRKKMGLRVLNPFYRSNPVDIGLWIENDRDALIHAIEKAHELTGGKPRPPLDMEWIGG